MSEVPEGPPVCLACEVERQEFPCRTAQGDYFMEKVAAALRDYYRLAASSDRQDRTLRNDVHAWAPECVAELILESPNLALDFILQALPLFETDEDVAVLAAGPMEDLLGYHSESLIDRIEAEAAENGRFRLLLSGVWGRNNVRIEVWRRLQKAIGNGPWLDGDPRRPQGSKG